MPPVLMQNADRRICIRSFGDEAVVFHEGSGDLHLLNGVAAAVLSKLCEPSESPQTLAADVAESLGYESDPQFEETVAGLLRYFDRLGLIQTCEPARSAE